MNEVSIGKFISEYSIVAVKRRKQTFCRATVKLWSETILTQWIRISRCRHHDIIIKKMNVATIIIVMIVGPMRSFASDF